MLVVSHINSLPVLWGRNSFVKFSPEFEDFVSFVFFPCLTSLSAFMTWNQLPKSSRVNWEVLIKDKDTERKCHKHLCSFAKLSLLWTCYNLFHILFQLIIISLKVFVTIVVLTLLVSFEHVLENSCNSKKAHTT